MFYQYEDKQTALEALEEIAEQFEEHPYSIEAGDEIINDLNMCDW